MEKGITQDTAILNFVCFIVDVDHKDTDIDYDDNEWWYSELLFNIDEEKKSALSSNWKDSV